MFADGSGMDEHLFEIDSTSGAEVYQTDYLGSVLNPDLNSKEGYGLFGEVVGSISPVGNYRTLEYGYSGREYEADTGLYYFRARYYDPEMGRFLTKDPIGLAGGHTNLYLYCGNDPVNCVDPDGKNPLTLPLTAAGAIAGAYNNYQAAAGIQGISGTQLLATTLVGAVSGGAAGAAASFGVVPGVLGAAGAAFGNNGINQVLLSPDIANPNISPNIDLGRAATAGLYSGGAALISGGASSVLNRTFFPIVSETTGTAIGGFLGGQIDSGAPLCQ